MSQEEVYKILKELGGEASTKQIRQRAKEKFPNASLYTYVGDRLNKLRKKGFVTRTFDKKGNAIWKIIDEYPVRG